MTYSYGRALQQSALKYWSKNIKDIKNTQKIFDHRANMNSLLPLKENGQKRLTNSRINKRIIYLISPKKIKNNFFYYEI